MPQSDALADPGRLRVLLLRPPDGREPGISHPHHVYPPLLLKYIEAGISASGVHAVRLIDGWTGSLAAEVIARQAIAWHPDLLVVQPQALDPRDGLALAAAIRTATGCLVVACGAAVELHPAAMREPGLNADLAIVGEAERAIPALVRRLGDTSPGLRAAALNDTATGPWQLTGDELDALPFPSYAPEESEAYEYRSYPIRMAAPARWGFVLSSRGCPHGCLFCSPVMRKTTGRRLRLRSPSNVVDELERLAARGHNVVSFEDDDLTASRVHLSGICREILQRRLALRWICHARVDELDADLLCEMAGAGCVLLRLGVESGSEEVLDRLQKNPRRLPWTASCKAVFSEARRLGVATNALVILGNPGETRDQVNCTIDLVLALDPDLVQAHYFTPYPGSGAADLFSHLVPPESAGSLHHYGLPIANVSAMTLRELEGARNRLYRRFFVRPRFLARHAWHYGRFYLANPGVAIHLLRGLTRLQAS